jgi:hypothetical protein
MSFCFCVSRFVPHVSPPIFAWGNNGETFTLKSLFFALFQLFDKSLETIYSSAFRLVFRPCFRPSKVIPPGFNKLMKVGELWGAWGNGFVILF